METAVTVLCLFACFFLSFFGKMKRHITYIAPQATTAAALYVTDRAGVKPVGPSLSLWPRDFDLRLTAIHSPGLPFNGLHLLNPYNYMDSYWFTNPKGIEGWVGVVGRPIADTISESPRAMTDVLTTEPTIQMNILSLVHRLFCRFFLIASYH